MKLLDPGEDGVYLESKSPSFRLSVVFLKHVDLFSAEILPFCHGLLDPLGFGNSLSEEFEEGGFSASDVAFDSKTKIVGPGFWVDEIFRENLILISR